MEACRSEHTTKLRAIIDFQHVAAGQGNTTRGVSKTLRHIKRANRDLTRLHFAVNREEHCPRFG
jgi:hypothetical protein